MNHFSMDKPYVWHDGPPPHVGWWNTTLNPDVSDSGLIWRWWDGQNWSLAAYTDCSVELATLLAGVHTSSASNMRWCHYYPANARVPRVSPDNSPVKMAPPVKAPLPKLNLWVTKVGSSGAVSQHGPEVPKGRRTINAPT